MYLNALTFVSGVAAYTDITGVQLLIFSGAAAYCEPVCSVRVC